MNDPKASLWSKTDGIVACAIFITAFVIALAAVASFTNAGHRPVYYGNEFAPAVLLACGHGFVNPPHHTSSMEPGPGFEALASFLHERRDSLECSELPRSFRAEPVNLFQATHRYLMTVAASVWMVTGVSWPALKIISAIFSGMTACLVYLLARSSMGSALSLVITSIWITSPVQLEQLPHLRDYAKAPFFMVTLCAVAWIAMTRASRGRTIMALAFIGAVLGVGFGFRTDVISYLPFVLFAVLLFRPVFSRTDLVTRGLAATAAVAAFIVTASPILRAYQSADNVAHVAMLGLSDPSRDWLKLHEAPYSYGYLYHDEYLATVIAGYSERQGTANQRLLLGTPGYTQWSNEYYRRLLVTFPGDMLVRAWAATIGVFRLPFQQVNLARPAWIDPSMDAIFQYRGSAMTWLGVLPPIVAASILAVGVSVVSLRLFGVLMLFGVIVPGMTSIQFHQRHVFHLEVLSLFTYGCLLHFGWKLVRHLNVSRSTVVPIAVRATLVACGLTAFAVLPVFAARAYQAGNIATLFSAYESAEVVRIEATQLQQPDGQLLLAAPLEPSRHPGHFIDTTALVITVGGDQCDADVVPLLLRYRAVPYFVDLTRQTVVPVPAAGGSARLVFPVYNVGARSSGRESPRFVGVEVAPAEAPCIQSLDRIQESDKFPLLLESMLLPDWRQRPLYEALRGLEPRSDNWRIENYSIPDGLRPGGRWLSQLAAETSPATYRSPQVLKLDDREIEIRGDAASRAAYLLSWAESPRPMGSVFFVEGELFEGGLTVGIQAKEQWVQQINVLRPGRFRAAIQVEQPGVYGAVLANNQQQGIYARIIVSRYGWLPPAPVSP